MLNNVDDANVANVSLKNFTFKRLNIIILSKAKLREFLLSLYTIIILNKLVMLRS